MTFKRFTTEEKISELHENWKRSSLQVSPDGRQIGFIYLHKKGEFKVKINHKIGPSFEEIGNLQFAPDSSSYAYLAKNSAGHQVIWRDSAGPTFSFIGSDSLVYSDDGQHIAYTALQGDTWKIIVDHQEAFAYENTDILQLAFTPSTHKIAAVVETIDGVHLEIDGEAQAVYESISELSFSHDGTQAAYTAEKENDKYLVLNGEELVKADNVRQPLFSQQSSSFAFAYRMGDDWCVRLNETEFGPYENAAQLVFSPDGLRLAYTCQRGDDFSASINGTDEAFFDGVGQPVFSADSQRLAYAARRTHKKFLQAIETYFVVVDGEEKQVYSAIGQSGLSFSPDSQRLGYKAQLKELHFVVVDDTESTKFDGVGANTPIFSPDSKHYAFVANFQRKSAVVIDDEAGEEYSAVVLKGGGKLAFTSENTLQYLASRKSEIYFVEEKLEEDSGS